jgi:hydrogenase maturation protease
VSRRLVVGVGNDLRGDDAAGLEVARRVRLAAPAGVEVVEASGDGAALIDAWQNAALAVVVDACVSGAEPGTIRRFEAARAPLPAVLASRSTHAFGLAEAVEMARALGRLPDRLVVFAIEGRDFAAGAPLSPAVARAVAEAVTAVLREIAAA